jgi:hypothetical protein
VFINAHCFELLYLGYNKSFAIGACAGDLLNYKRPDISRLWFWWAEGDSNFGGLKETAISFTIFYFNIKILNKLKLK